MNTTAQLADAAVRERALDPSTSFIVQAPAGSGKTQLLTSRYLRLLAVVEQPEAILAITFTRKAAAQMRSRILKALAMGASASPPAEEHHRQTWLLARAALAADARHGWQLLAHPARLKIQTIDALNHALAKQLPILSGAGATLALADDPEPLYAAAVLRVIGRLGSDDAVARAVERLVRQLDNRLDSVSALLIDLLARRDHWLDLDLLEDPEALRRRLEDALAAAVTQRLARLRQRWPGDTCKEIVILAAAARASLLATDAQHPLVTSGGLPHFPGAGVADDDLGGWQRVRELLLTDKGHWRKTVTVNDGFPPASKSAKQRMLALLEYLRQHEAGADLAAALQETRDLPASRYSATQWATIESLLAVLRIALAELTLIFREQGAADHAAAALAARSALGLVDAPTDLALRLDYQLKHLLVDEFQDTSRGQIRLLRLLTAGWTRGDGRSLFVVGDPMQSIYRFREADVGLFLKLKAEGLGDIALEPLTLTVNFRSTQPVIDWINQSFSSVLPAADDPERGAVRFTASEPRPEAPSGGGVHFHALRGSRLQTQALEAERVVEIVLSARQKRPEGSIAILVTNRSHLAGILPVLAARGLRYRAIDIDPLITRPLVQDLLALTRALSHLADRTAWLAVLRAPWCGLTLADLHVLAADGVQRRSPDTTLWSRLHDARVLARLTDDGRVRLARVQHVLSQALDERGRHGLRDWIERAWLALHGPAATATPSELADATAYFSRLERLADCGDLNDVARLEHEMADLYAMPDATLARETTLPSIEVMTVHKAKGLEFDTVILPGLERRGGRDGERLLRWIELPRTDGPALVLGPLAAREDDPDPLYQWLGAIDRQRAAYERGRQLYVGATRAVSELHLIGAVQPADKEGVAGLKPLDGESLLKLLWPQVASHFDALPAAIPAAAPVTAGPVRSLRRLPPSWLPAFGTLPAIVTRAAQPIVDTALQPDFDWVSETSRHVGTLVHREIERMARQGRNPLPTPDDAALPRLERELAELGVPQAHRLQAAQRVVLALANLLNDERGRWLLAGSERHAEVASELALTGLVRGSVVNGVIDRTFIDEQGIRWVVDFKTSTHSGAGLQAFLDSEVERYRPQLSRYAHLMREFRPGHPVRAALYFPLLTAWREVTGA